MTTSASEEREIRDRIGISIGNPSAPALLDTIREAEAAGVAQVWMTQNPRIIDALTFYAAAISQTSRIRLGTSIVPTYPRHPLVMAQQAATVDALGPGRLRLGIGPSHKPIIEPIYGIPMSEPLTHLDEYVTIVRAALHDGAVDFSGKYLTAKLSSAPTAHVPVLVSALGEQAFRHAGQHADGAISWNCPIPYLRDVALPALHNGAAQAGRPRPTLVAHFWISLSTDRDAVRAAMRKGLEYYPTLPFYAKMFAAAGYPVPQGGGVSDELADALVIAGTEEQIREQIRELLDQGIDELLLTSAAVGDAAQEQSRLFQLIGSIA
ncbi:LLM class flavin-dependent oxidoreductase [Chloroflexia bacterium SDU3-3]|nr:LLM class flavin-dependent oxidoreductase [Chloroflexia bacterium SDU3-3]